ncbi:MAG TPA: acetylglutamate kinase [Rectinemataceae bacterium]|nr:acetylglutamate kinase [Rectinemataceae bacterium]
MSFSDSARAEALASALPFMRSLAGKTVVVKYGGAAMTEEAARLALAEDLVLMASVGIRTVLVHGGGPEIDAMLRRVGKEPVFIGGLRRTDEETMELVQMVLAGKVNKGLVALIQRKGGRAVGLCGLDGGLLQARKLREGPDLGLVGEIVAVDTGLITAALAAACIAVVATVAAGLPGEAEVYNVNADTAAAELALALGAERLLLLTDVPGILLDIKDEGSLVREIGRGELDGYIARGIVSKGMIPKLRACVRALEGGVKSAHIIDGRAPHGLLLELFSEGGKGTMIS